MGGPKVPKPAGASETETGIQDQLTEWWQNEMANKSSLGEGSTNALGNLEESYGKGLGGAIPKALAYAKEQIMGEGTSFDEYYDPERKAVNRRYADDYDKTVNSAAGRGIFGSSAVQDMGSRLAEGRESSLAEARSGARRDYQDETQNRFGRGLSALGFASNQRARNQGKQRDLYDIERERGQELYGREQRKPGQGLAMLGAHREGRQQTWDELNEQYQNKQKKSSDTASNIGGAVGGVAGLFI